jgi:hypothetical protein
VGAIKKEKKFNFFYMKSQKEKDIPIARKDQLLFDSSFRDYSNLMPPYSQTTEIRNKLSISENTPDENRN